MSLLSQQSAVGFADLGKERRQLLRPAKNTGTLEPIRLFERVCPEGSSLAQRISVHHRAVKPVMLWRLGFWNSSKIAIKHGPRARLNKLIRPFDCSLAFLFNLPFFSPSTLTFCFITFVTGSLRASYIPRVYSIGTPGRYLSHISLPQQTSPYKHKQQFNSA